MGWCPECGCSTSRVGYEDTFGVHTVEIVCEDPDCAYWVYAEEEDTTTQGEN